MVFFNIDEILNKALEFLGMDVHFKQFMSSRLAKNVHINKTLRYRKWIIIRNQFFLLLFDRAEILKVPSRFIHKKVSESLLNLY